MKLDHIFHLLYFLYIPTIVFNYLWAQDKWNCGPEKNNWVLWLLWSPEAKLSGILHWILYLTTENVLRWLHNLFLNTCNNTAFQRCPLLSSLNLAVEGGKCIMDWKYICGASEELCCQQFSLSLLLPLIVHFHTYHRHLAKHHITAMPTLRHPVASDPNTVLSPSRCLQFWLQAPRWTAIYLILKLFHILAPLHLCLKTPL